MLIIILNIPEYIYFDVIKSEQNETSCGYRDEIGLTCDI
jgi:hypothetical protein